MAGRLPVGCFAERTALGATAAIGVTEVCSHMPVPWCFAGREPHPFLGIFPRAQAHSRLHPRPLLWPPTGAPQGGRGQVGGREGCERLSCTVHAHCTRKLCFGRAGRQGTCCRAQLTELTMCNPSAASSTPPSAAEICSCPRIGHSPALPMCPAWLTPTASPPWGSTCCWPTPCWRPGRGGWCRSGRAA